MDRTWLAFDVNNLAHRAYWTTGGLSYEDVPTGVMFGVLKTVEQLADAYDTRDLVFCFDHGKSLRYNYLPSYKESRKRKVDEERARQLDEVRIQIERIKTRYLEELGFHNVFYKAGYEADDVIASVVKNTDPDDRVIMVSSDQDLFQLLDYRTAQHLPTENRLFTAKDFKAEYLIRPNQWTAVKTLAGCSSDDIPGCAGIGEKTAVKYLRGELPLKSAFLKKIQEHVRTEDWERDSLLVTLPFPGCPAFEPVPEKLNPKAWREFCTRMGMESLAENPNRWEGLPV